VCRQAKAGTHEQHGWPTSAYGVSKAGLILATRIQQANIDKDSSRQDIVINAVSRSLTLLN
jgi:carbonyl reductase 1